MSISKTLRSLILKGALLLAVTGYSVKPPAAVAVISTDCLADAPPQRVTTVLDADTAVDDCHAGIVCHTETEHEAIERSNALATQHQNVGAARVDLAWDPGGRR